MRVKSNKTRKKGGETEASATQRIQIGCFAGVLSNRCRNEEDLSAIKSADFQKRPNEALQRSEGKRRYRGGLTSFGNY